MHGNKNGATRLQHQLFFPVNFFVSSNWQSGVYGWLFKHHNWLQALVQRFLPSTDCGQELCKGLLVVQEKGSLQIVQDGTWCYKMVNSHTSQASMIFSNFDFVHIKVIIFFWCCLFLIHLIVFVTRCIVINCLVVCISCYNAQMPEANLCTRFVFCLEFVSCFWVSWHWLW